MVIDRRQFVQALAGQLVGLSGAGSNATQKWPEAGTVIPQLDAKTIIEHIDWPQNIPYYITVIGVGDFGAHQVSAFQKKYSQTFRGINLRYFAVNCDSPSEPSHKTQQPSIPGVGRQLSSEPDQACSDSLHASHTMSCDVNHETAYWNVLDKRCTANNTLILLTDITEDKCAGISHSISAQASQASTAVFALAALPPKSEKLYTSLAAEMRLLEGVCDGVLYFDQESCPQRTFFPPVTSFDNQMRVTKLRVENCFHELLKCLTFIPLEESMVECNMYTTIMRYLDRNFIKEGRIGHGFGTATSIEAIQHVLTLAFRDAQEMAACFNPQNIFIRIAQPPELQEWFQKRKILYAIRETPILGVMASSTQCEVDHSLVDNIEISVFLAREEWGSFVFSAISEGKQS